MDSNECAYKRVLCARPLAILAYSPFRTTAAKPRCIDAKYIKENTD